MAVDGYSEEQYERLVREVRSVLQHTLGAKRPHHESSSEHDADDSEQSPSEQRKKRRQRSKRAHLLRPGPTSGLSSYAIAASQSGPAPDESPSQKPTVFTKAAVLRRTSL
ncbi:hypothetical protein HO173_008086 [Letharia columbiana]|uniref:Uncharacterized protein n=1 Tax=Letharia columbiana TaxID=112416 RepID=A0A8H6L389_9LECA|nr:uncharacterized protein HO173_008086 [Letharia columbiana]KAF6233874.1 hypothetical protein HO173_008086 [Letharia columbiana]